MPKVGCDIEEDEHEEQVELKLSRKSKLSFESHMSKLFTILHGQQRSFQKFVNLVHSLPGSHVNQRNNNENSSHKDFCHGMTDCKIFKIVILTIQ